MDASHDLTRALIFEENTAAVKLTGEHKSYESDERIEEDRGNNQRHKVPRLVAVILRPWSGDCQKCLGSSYNHRDTVRSPGS